eukprot:CAMPEP_0114669354 /NCGR_PEP_ID=MMETSP0191-20121206/37927_1 /TAXON_ID=126664 /ORGANISM="Sorites sp." /LENGTH=198 /DNA_ID=CAMNT_0001924819 /DNA_START=166 /DNA_END=759 /DNA_ORIENTATION=+
MAKAMMNSSWVASAKDTAVKAIQVYNHNTLNKFCTTPGCTAGKEQLDKEYGTCYGGTLCAAMSQQLDYTKCKAAMEETLPYMLRIQESAACAKDGDFYCAELQSGLMVENLKCYAMFMTPGVYNAHCEPECVELWKQKQQEHPGCMALLESEMKEAYVAGDKLSKALILANKDETMHGIAVSMNQSMSTFADVCIRNK